MTELVSIGQSNHAFYESFLPISIRETYLADEHIALFGIDEDNTACGAMALRLIRPEAELLWIFLAEDHRGRGVATTAMIDLMFRLRDEDYEQIVVSEPPASSGAEGLQSLLAAFPHFWEESETATAYSTVSELRSVRELASPAASSVALSQVSSRTLNALEQSILENGSDLVPIPVHRSEFLEDLSAVYMDGRDPRGILLAQQTSSQIITISFIYTVSPDPSVLLDMMRFFLSRAAENPRRTFLRMNLVNPDLLEFLTKRAHVEAMHGRSVKMDLSWVDRVRREALVSLTA